MLESATSTVTQFAPAARSDSNAIERQKKLLSESYAPLKQLYDAVAEIILIVNKDRQIVFFNSGVPFLLGIDNEESIYGLRPGEALGCRHAGVNPCGCGTSVFCKQCGAVKAILASLSNKADLQECRVLKKGTTEALNLLVKTTPFQIDGERFSIMAITDISHEKRRRALERIFFHDIMNTAASLNLFAKMLAAEQEKQDPNGVGDKLRSGFDQLMEELNSQKELLAAENNELLVKKQTIDGYSLLSDLVMVYRKRFNGHSLALAPKTVDVVLHTDPVLLKRVLGNMIINAIEASQPQETIRISCGAEEGYAVFSVHNKSTMPEEIRLQLFQRSFSTKGAGHGLGTYSMKLLSERYLNGRVRFRSSAQHGTTFEARYPI